MRSLRLLSIVLFIVICGPLLLICWYKNRPVPTENPQDLIKNLTLVKVDEYKTLRAMNYRHAPTPRSSSSNGDGSINLSNPYDDALDESSESTALDSCCICMEDFESGPAESDLVVDNEIGILGGNQNNLMVVLPCKSHFFHEVCIASWIQKQNACPICRTEITLASLKSQKKEVNKLLEQAAKKGTP